MKTLLFLLLFTTTLQAQTIESELTKIETSLENIRSIINEEPISDFRCERVNSSRFDCFWTAHTTGVMDIEFYSPERDEPFYHSFSKWAPDEKPGIQDEHKNIGVNDLNDYIARARVGEWVSEPVEVEPLGENVELPARDILYGYWDSTPDKIPQIKDHVNVAKGLSTDVQYIIDTGLPAIPMISGFNGTEDPSEWEKRLRVKAEQHLNNYSPEEVPFIILIDEPYSKHGWTAEKLQKLHDLAEEVMPQHTFGYTIKELAASDGRELPQTGVLGINLYPYRHNQNNDIDDTKEALISKVKSVLNDVRKKTNTDLFIVGQGFHGERKWRKPPAESPLWYLEAIRDESDVFGLLFYELRNRDGSESVGSLNNPELFERQREGFRVID